MASKLHLTFRQSSIKADEYEKSLRGEHYLVISHEYFFRFLGGIGGMNVGYIKGGHSDFFRWKKGLAKGVNVLDSFMADWHHWNYSTIIASYGETTFIMEIIVLPLFLCKILKILWMQFYSVFTLNILIYEFNSRELIINCDDKFEKIVDIKA